jgi:PKD repeat protein
MEFGDGNSSSTLSDPAYLYTNPGNYKVLLTAISSNNCEEFLTKSITVDALPVPNFIVQDVCVDIQISPANFSTGSISGQTWNFGDGKTDTTRLPKHIYTSPGIYTIKLTVKSGLGCTDSTSKTILVFTKPTIKISDDVGLVKDLAPIY